MASGLLCAWVGVSAAPADAHILFPRDSPVPATVREFAWRVIETRCSDPSHERAQRSFWAHDAGARSTDEGVVYSISIIADIAWRKREPPATIEMSVVADGGLRLAALRSSFIACAP